MPRDERKRRFEELVQAHRGIVYKVAFSYTRNAADREDLAQEICLQLWRSFAGYDPARRFSTWMYRVALNVAISYARRSAREARQPCEPLDARHLKTIAAHAAKPQDERVDKLHAFINALKPLDRSLMVLLLDDRSYAEIAVIVGLSETNVASRIHRIKNQLRGQAAAIQTGAQA